MIKILFSEYSQTWLASKKKHVKPATYSNYLFALEKHINPYLKDYFVDEIDTKVLQDMIQKWQTCGRLNGKKLSSKTAIDYFNITKAVLSSYRKEAELPAMDYGDIEVKQDGRNEIEVFTTAEMATILTHIFSGKSSGMDVAIGLSLTTGMRIGEICALKWGDFDFKRRTIKVSKTLERVYFIDRSDDVKKSEIIEGSPKTSQSHRLIPITSTVKNLLDLLGTDHASDDYVVSGTTKATEPSSLRKHYYRFLSKYDLPKFNFHALRHSFATRALITNPKDPKAISEILGHASVQTTLSLYVHPTMEDKRNILEQVNYLG